MAEFNCRLGTPAGEVVTRTVEASEVGELRKRLEMEGFRVFSVQSVKSQGFPGMGSLGEKRIRIKPGDFLLFTQQLAALFKAGIPILQAIAMLRRRAASEALRSVLGDVEEKIRGGDSLSTAFASQGTVFPRIYTASILAGERSGALDEVLNRYVAYMRRGVETRRKIRGALAYPILLLLASLGMVAFLSLYVVPKMSQLFTGFGVELPLITVLVVGISNKAASNLFWLGPLFIGGVFAFYIWSKTPDGRFKIDTFLLKLPVVGQLIIQLTAAQTTRSMATLLAGGITLVESWEIASESIVNKALRARSMGVLPMIREGRTFTESLESAGWMPELGLDMIGVGERSGSLKEMLEEVASFFDAEAAVRLEQLTTILEPAILLVMGAIVITILLAIYLPIVQSISNASHR
jgi:type IV pilus assembly protein PilC